MVDSNKIKALMLEKGLNQSEVAEKMGLKYKTFNKKINNTLPFLTKEIESLCEILKIKQTDIGKIFFKKIEVKYIGDL